MNAIEVGFAKVDITPQKARQTIYHRSGTIDDAKTPIRDRLYARATAFRKGDVAAIWVTADLLCVDTALRNRVVARLAAEGVPPEHVALCATHTHTAPTIVHFHSVDPTPDEVLAFLESSMVKAALEALRSAKPAQISCAKSTADLSVNRREIGRMAQINNINSPTGLVDKEVAVAKIEMLDTAGVGVLFNYSAHPLTMSKDCPQISADYPGRTVEYLETDGKMGFAQFFQGCAGNANIKIHGREQEAIMAGRWLAQAVLAAAAAAESPGPPELRMATQTVRLPWGKMATVDEAKALASAKPNDRRTAEWAEAVRRTRETGPASPHAEVIVQAMRIGDAVFVALPGEVFLEIGLAIKKHAGVENMFAIAYSNNCEIGYVPTAAAFTEGGYEVDQAPYYYGLFQLSPECERIMVEAGLSAVRSVS